MNKNSIIKKFLDRPYTIEMGANKLSRWWKVDVEIIREARREVKELLRNVVVNDSKPKILVFDIETSPLKAHVYQKSVWRSNVTANQVISEWFMLSWSARFLGSTETHSDVLTSEEAIGENDKRIVKSLWHLLDEADIVITHNGDHFDVPNMNTRFVFHDMKPTSPYQSIDTLRIVKKQFGFTHNGLDAIAKVFGFDAKMQTNFQLWVECTSGNEKALKYMEEYNIHDVELLELVYLKLRPWIKGHPNIGLFLEEDIPICPNCGGKELTHTDKYYYTSVAKYETLRCGDCGAIARMRVNEYPKDLRKQLVVSIYR